MSFVHDIVLLTAISEEMERSSRNDPIGKLNSYLKEHHDREFQRVDKHAGGDKGFQAAAYMVAINYLRIDDFLALFEECVWAMPDSVMLLYKGEHDNHFTVGLPSGVELYLHEDDQ